MIRLYENDFRRLLQHLLAALLFFIMAAVSAQAQDPPAPKSPANSASTIAAAKKLLNRGDLQGAENALWPVLSANPTPEALTMLGYIRAQQQRYLEAEALFRRVIQLDPKSALAHKNLANALLAQDKTDDAIEQFKQAAKLAPLDSALKLDLANIYVEKKQFAEALSTLATIPPDHFPADAIPVKAASLLALGRKSEAAALAQNVKNSPEVALDLAEVYLHGNLPDSALATLTLAAPPGKRLPARYYYLKGRALEDKGQTDSALKNLQQALALDPNSSNAMFSIAELFATENRHADSFAMLMRAKAVNPDSLSILRSLIIESLRAQHPSKALENAYVLWEKSPDNLDDLRMVGATMVLTREFNAAIQVLEKYLVQRPNDALSWEKLGEADIELSKYPDARKALVRALQIDPKFSEAEYQIGVLSEREQEIDEATRHYERVLVLKPQHAKALAALGALYLQEGELQKAQEMLQRSEAAAPDNPETQYKLSMAYNRLGKTEEARLHMDRYLKLKGEQDEKDKQSPEQQENMK